MSPVAALNPTTPYGALAPIVLLTFGHIPIGAGLPTATSSLTGTAPVPPGQGGQQVITAQDLALHLMRMEQHILLLQTQMESQRQALLLASMSNNPSTTLPLPTPNVAAPFQTPPTFTANLDAEHQLPSTTTSSYRGRSTHHRRLGKSQWKQPHAPHLQNTV